MSIQNLRRQDWIAVAAPICGRNTFRRRLQIGTAAASCTGLADLEYLIVYNEKCFVSRVRVPLRRQVDETRFATDDY
jgi:hypothetical protein